VVGPPPPTAWPGWNHHENVVAFAARQWLDMFSPGNQLPTNPVVLRRTLTSGGANLVQRGPC
jgi:polyhydroxyalkanoate synthase